LEDIVPVLPSSKILPKWFKELPDTTKIIDGVPITQGNIKKCPAVVDMLLQGWVLPMWTDLYINCTKEKIEWKASDDSFKFDVHSNKQFIDVMPGFLKDKYYWVFKGYSPWLVKTSPGYSVYALNPFYHFNTNFDIAEGVQFSDVYFDTNPIFIIKKLGEFVIPRGTPLTVYVPFKREKIEGKIIPYSNETVKLLNKKHLITNTMFSSAKSYNTAKPHKCPFA